MADDSPKKAGEILTEQLNKETIRRNAMVGSYLNSSTISDVRASSAASWLGGTVNLIAEDTRCMQMAGITSSWIELNPSRCSETMFQAHRAGFQLRHSRPRRNVVKAHSEIACNCHGVITVLSLPNHDSSGLNSRITSWIVFTRMPLQIRTRHTISAILNPLKVSPESVLSNLAFLTASDVRSSTFRNQAYEEKSSLENDVTI